VDTSSSGSGVAAATLVAAVDAATSILNKSGCSVLSPPLVAQLHAFVAEYGGIAWEDVGSVLLPAVERFLLSRPCAESMAFAIAQFAAQRQQHEQHEQQALLEQQRTALKTQQRLLQRAAKQRTAPPQSHSLGSLAMIRFGGDDSGGKKTTTTCA